MTARHEEECYEQSILNNFHVCEGVSNDDVGVARGTTVLQEIRPDVLVSKPAISLKES